MTFHKEVANDELTYTIIGHAIDVHRELGPHQLEKLYHQGLCVLLNEEGIDFTSEHEVDITLRGHKLGTALIDILVQDELVLELKAVRQTTADHFNQLGRNVRAAGATRGLLLNFGQPTLSTRRWANSRGR